MKAFTRAPLENATYERDGKWFTHAVIDSANAIERAATEDEIAAAQATLKPDAPKAAKAKAAK